MTVPDAPPSAEDAAPSRSSSRTLDAAGIGPLARAVTPYEVIGWLGAGLLVALVVLAPVLGHLGTRIIGGNDDAQWYAAIGAHIGRSLRSFDVPFRLNGLIAPHRLDVRATDGTLGLLVVGVFGTITGVCASVNLALTAAVSSNVVAGCFVARQVTTQRAAVIVTGIAVGCAPVTLQRATAHLSLCFAAPTVLAVALALRQLQRNRRLPIVATAAVLVLAYLASIYYFIPAVGVVAAGQARAWAFSRRIRGAIPLVAVMALTFLVLSPFLVTRFRFDGAERRAGFDEGTLSRDYRIYSADALAFAMPAAPTAASSVLGRAIPADVAASTVPTREGYAFPGIAMLIGVGGVVTWRSRSRLVLLASIALLWTATLGPALRVLGHRVGPGPDGFPLPFALVESIPILRSVRASGRLSLGLPAMLAPGLAVVAASVLGRMRSTRSRVGVVALLLALVAATVPRLPSTALAVGPGPVRTALHRLDTTARPGDRFLYVPNCDGTFLGLEAIVTTYHHVPAVGCHGQYLGTPFLSGLADYRTSLALAATRCGPQRLGYADTAFPASTLPSEDGLLALRRQFGVRFVFVDRVPLVKPYCSHLGAALPAAFARFAVLAQDSRYTLYDLAEQAVP